MISYDTFPLKNTANSFTHSCAKTYIRHFYNILFCAILTLLLLIDTNASHGNGY